jgi:hypothetical protein
MKCGATQSLELTDKHLEICNKHREEIQHYSQKQGRNGLIEEGKYTVVEGLSQVVAGVNYFFNIRLTDSTDTHIWVRIFQDLNGKTTLHSVQVGKTTNDPLVYF